MKSIIESVQNGLRISMPVTTMSLMMLMLTSIRLLLLLLPLQYRIFRVEIKVEEEIMQQQWYGRFRERRYTLIVVVPTTRRRTRPATTIRQAMRRISIR